MKYFVPRFRNNRLISAFLIGFSFLIYQSNASLVLANTDTQSYCSQIFQSVNKVYIGIEGNVPNVSDDDWHKILLSLKEKNLKYFEGNGLEIDIPSERIEEESIYDPNSLYAVLRISYGERHLFSIPLESNQLVIWVDVSKRGKNGEVRKYSYNPRFVSYSPSVNPDFLMLSSSMYGSFENLVCDVFQGGMNLFCTNRRDFSKNKLERRNSECKNMREDGNLREVLEFIEKNKVYGDETK